MLYGCKIGDGVLIGMGLIILNNVIIGENSLIGVGFLVIEGKIILLNVLVFGWFVKVICLLMVVEIVSNYMNVLYYI